MISAEISRLMKIMIFQKDKFTKCYKIPLLKSYDINGVYDLITIIYIFIISIEQELPCT